MGGTVEGGRKAAATTKALHGDDFYKRIGAVGGSKQGPKGFALNRERARLAGAKGGRISRRKPTVENGI
jgi:general stress protein YciG